MRNKKVLFLTQAAVIAAIYVVLTIFISAFNLASGAIQVRISEALTILPFFTPAAIPGLFAGCLLSKILTGCCLIDIVFGSLATLVAAFVSYGLRKHKWLVAIPPIVANALVVPFVLIYGYGVNSPVGYLIATVGAGEVLSCGVIGMILLLSLDKVKGSIFGARVKQ